MIKANTLDRTYIGIRLCLGSALFTISIICWVL